MADRLDGPPVAVLPERFERRLRLGPFPSARDALKFVSYAAVGALLASISLPYLWLPIVGAGFVVSVWRPEGRSIDRRCVEYLAWCLRSLGRGGSMTRLRRSAELRGGLLRIGPGHFVAILRTEGAPFDYLPPAELGRRFEEFRSILRGLDSGLALLVGAEPIQATRVLPPVGSVGPADRDARNGYSELVDALASRRSQRRVYVALATGEVGPNAVSGLVERAEVLRTKLSGLGLRAIRLTGRSLRDAGRRYGWTTGNEGG